MQSFLTGGECPFEILGPSPNTCIMARFEDGGGYIKCGD
jgi:hypothetical protein